MVLYYSLNPLIGVAIAHHRKWYAETVRLLVSTFAHTHARDDLIFINFLLYKAQYWVWAERQGDFQIRAVNGQSYRSHIASDERNMIR